YATARTYLEASRVAAAESADATKALARPWRFVGGQIALHEGHYPEARLLLTEAIGLADDPAALSVGYCQMNLGSLAREVGDVDEAGKLLRQSLDRAELFGDRTLIAHSVEGIAALATARGEHVNALRLGGAAAALRESIGGAHSPAWERMIERWLAMSRAV